MERNLELTFRFTDDGHFEAYTYEPESGESSKFSRLFSFDNYKEFDEAICDEIYSWLSLWREEEEPEEEEPEAVFRDSAEVAKDLMDTLGARENTYGNKVSDYIVLASRGDRDISVSIIHEKYTAWGTLEKEPWFTLHMIDDINEGDCELHFTDTDTMEELISLLDSLKP